MRARRLTGALLAAGALAAAAPAALAGFQDEEPKNYSKTNERFEHEYGKPEYQALLRQKGIEEEVERAKIRVDDPERDFSGNLCSSHQDGCAGDVRFYDWDKQPGNVRVPVLWTARSGATIAGHVWMVRGGAARKPGIVITSGSVQAPQQLYWGLAAAFARAGYVVLSWDPQTQGRSDRPGEEPTQNENATAQSEEAFTEGTVDAIDFFLSTPSAPFRPRASRTRPDVAHTAKQDRRVREGKNAAFNPLHASVEPDRLGSVGHSLGALGVSKVASADRRVDAVVAWDNLRARSGFSDTGGSPIPPRVPALGMSGDYGTGSGGAAGVTPAPRRSAPDPQVANAGSRTFSKAGIDTAQVNTKAGTHFEYGYVPNPAFGATLRGIDKVAWYTIGWFDKYVKRDPEADRLLLTNRWQRDAIEAAVDPDRDPNLFSKDLRSRVDVARSSGGRALCEDLRTGCGILVDDRAGPFSVLDFAYGRQSMKPRRPARCATALKVPKRLDLSRSKRRLRLRLRLGEATRVRVGVRRGRQRRRTAKRTPVTLRAGRRVLTLRIPRRARPGRYRVSIGMRCASARQGKNSRLRIVR